MLLCDCILKLSCFIHHIFYDYCLHALSVLLIGLYFFRLMDCFTHCMMYTCAALHTANTCATLLTACHQLVLFYRLNIVVPFMDCKLSTCAALHTAQTNASLLTARCTLALLYILHTLVLLSVLHTMYLCCSTYRTCWRYFFHCILHTPVLDDSFAACCVPFLY